MKKLIGIFMLVVITSTSLLAQAKQSNIVMDLPAQRFKALVDSDKKGFLIDLRTPEEIANGYIKGALFLDYLAKDSEARIDKLDKTKTYYVYCRSGKRSADCAAYMEAHGFKKVYNLEGGIVDWEKKGFPIEKK